MTITVPVVTAMHPRSSHRRTNSGTAAHRPGPQADMGVGHPTQEDEDSSPPETNTQAAVGMKRYKWIEGESLKEYSASAHKWKAHTSTQEFADAFIEIINTYAEDNELRSERVEDFLLAEATAAGVLHVTSTRPPTNPNRWAKHLAPWFNGKCKEARARYRLAVKNNGHMHAHTQEALKQFVT
jgi:hypothetical protein